LSIVTLFAVVPVVRYTMSLKPDKFIDPWANWPCLTTEGSEGCFAEANEFLP